MLAPLFSALHAWLSMMQAVELASRSAFARRSAEAALFGTSRPNGQNNPTSRGSIASFAAG
jgi:hypothetical protein